ncbi:MAG: thiamine-phosphate kinase [Bacteroidales bacterium]|nr:thiamine-phosphate kinase [Bacteroidales bacterium]
MKKGEFEFIDTIRRRFPAPKGTLGIGDDCAVIPQKSGMDTLVSTDMLIEGSHFLLSDVKPYDLGWKSAAVNISDIAGMGGKPVATFLSFAVPKNTDDSFLESFIEGYKDISSQFGIPLLGGDTVASNGSMCINVTILGQAPAGKARLRSTAKPGDIVYVSGTLGDSAAGLKVILEGIHRGPVEEFLIDRHYHPQPRINLGLKLAMTDGVHAMMDISDGVASDLPHILEASGVSADIDVKALPLSDEIRQAAATHGWDVLRLALEGGEDYELLVTADPSADLRKSGLTPIGKIKEKSAVQITWLNAPYMTYNGYHQF